MNDLILFMHLGYLHPEDGAKSTSPEENEDRSFYIVNL